VIKLFSKILPFKFPEETSEPTESAIFQSSSESMSCASNSEIFSAIVFLGKKQQNSRSA